MSAEKEGGPSLDAGGNYAVIRARLEQNTAELRTRAEAVNQRRRALFGGQELAIIGNERVRTEHNCAPRNLVQVNGRLLFGYNVQFALKKQVAVSDVFSLHACADTEGGLDLSALPASEIGGLLDDPRFVNEFQELYQYYVDARLVVVRHVGSKLLAVFRTGKGDNDIRVFRWSLSPGSPPVYIDNRGEKDHTRPAQQDFAWTEASRDDHILGRHPHINILDTVFVETIGGDLTIKIEDNTNTGQGIYAEPVDDRTQSLDDANVSYAKVGGLILLKIRPFGEANFRYLVYNTRSKSVTRIDAIGRACLQLPEEHGIIFPGGYYLQNGAVKLFDGDTTGLRFKRVVKSPNGEDVLYIFDREEAGTYVLLPYNLIRQEVSNPIAAAGYTFFDDGRMLLLKSEGDEPVRVHPIQIWRTPFCSETWAAAHSKGDGSYLARVGNGDLVRGLSELLALGRAVENLSPSRLVYEDLIKAATRALDNLHWLGHAEAGGLRDTVDTIRKNAELIIDEFEKLVAMQQSARSQLARATESWAEQRRGLRPDELASVSAFMGALTGLRQTRGHLISLREVRHIDLPAIDTMEAEVVAAFDSVSAAAVVFLSRPDSLVPLQGELDQLLTDIEATTKVVDIKPKAARLAEVATGVTLLIEVVSGLQVEDPTVRTAILERISDVMGHNNRVRAVLEARGKELRGKEARAEFGAQWKLLGQSTANAIASADTPEACDEQLGRVQVALEELDARFGEFDDYRTQLIDKREEVLEAFSARRQALVDERNRKVMGLFSAAERILEGVTRRASTFKDDDALNAWFSSDPMISRLRGLGEQLATLGDNVKSEELQSRLKAARQSAQRLLRDKTDLFTDGSDLISLGNHRFSVNRTAVELVVVPRGEGMALHINGTDFFEAVSDPDFVQTRDFWGQTMASETETVYRAEHLAASLLFAAERGEGPHSIESLSALPEGDLAAFVRSTAAERYDEGYERGVHDADAAAILRSLLNLRQAAGLLRFPAAARSLAVLFWAFFDEREPREAWHRQARAIGRMLQVMRDERGLTVLAATLAERMGRYFTAVLPSLAPLATPPTLALAGRYLVFELMAERPRFLVSADALALRDGLFAALDGAGLRLAFEEDLRALENRPDERVALCDAWLTGWLTDPSRAPLAHARTEALTLLTAARRLEREGSVAALSAEVPGLLGQHPRVANRTLSLRLDEALDRLGRHLNERVPGFARYRAARSALLSRERKRLRLDEFVPKVMTTFVRNRLISEVYLKLIGDNLAKQLGAAGANKRTDTMGMLLLISPPGYGKTTLMEYVASQLGLIFMKVNGPALGHEVTSLDPSEAPNATARQEVEKINLALEMGNNAMLYLDDIQHTHPELLQKFISLCDGTRRIEGVWKGVTRTYDLRGKKFCVVMAGNPYTESGARFQIPDMLANRADTYNLGDILGGREDLFALSYVENCLASNATLSPLAARDPKDLHRLVALAQGAEVDTATLSHAYSAAELGEIVSVLRHLFAVRNVLLKVNAEYIRSAAQSDAYRTEPPFKLQGSYRNMAKITEKIVGALTPAEVERIITDHYVSEAQTLTTGAEQNLLKLAELRGIQSPEQKARWEEIKAGFARAQLMGGKEDDPVTRVTGTLLALGKEMGGAREAMTSQLAGLREALRSQGGVEDQLSEVSGELRALRMAYTAPKLALEAPTGPVTPAEPAWPGPHLEVAAEADLLLRHAVLLEVQRALVAHGRMQARAAEPLRTADLILGATMPIMRELTEQVGELLTDRLAPAERDQAIDELRRRVARAISRLSEVAPRA